MTMATLTDLYINDHCANLGIFSRREMTQFFCPDGVTKIREDTFKGCTSLRSITFPDSVTTIERVAFSGCTALTQVICNNPDLFTDQNTQNRDQIQFISFGDYLRQNYPDLLTTLNPTGFNPDNVSFQ